MNWHTIKAEEIFELTGSRPEGLSIREAEEKLSRVGYNQLEEGKKKTVAAILLSQFKDVMILILLGAAIISGIFALGAACRVVTISLKLGACTRSSCDGHNSAMVSAKSPT